MNRNKLFAESFTHFEPTEENISVVEWLAEQMPGGLFIYRADEDGEILYVNSSVCDIFGCESVEEFRELTGNTFKGMVHPEDYDTIHDSIDDQIAQLDNKRNNDYVAYRIIRKDGEVRWVDNFGHFAMLPGYGEVYYVFISDITEKKLAEEEMEKAETLKLALKQGEEDSEEEDMITGLPEEIYEYPQLNAVKGVGYCGDVEDYMFALETYEKSIDARADQIEKDLKENNIEGFTMDVHSLKSTSGAIGATHLSEKAKELEMAGKEKNYDLLKKETPGLLEECREMHDILHRILEVYHAEEARAIRESLAERRILITEDMNIDAQIIRQVLRLRNMEADIASNGEEALRYFSENEPGYYAAILMDRHMPVMDGLQAAGKIRKLDRPDAGSIPIIALTGSSSVEDEEDSFAAGMNAHLVKPVEPDALFEVLEKLILGAK